MSYVFLSLYKITVCQYKRPHIDNHDDLVKKMFRVIISITMLATLRVPVTMASSNKNNNDFQKRIKKDSKKISKAFDKINKESEVRREDLSKNLKSWVEEIDKLAKKDVKKIQEIFEDSDIEGTVDIDDDDFETVDDVVVFKRNDVY